MTRCIKRINLKSSVYNQTGQNYFEQLEAYNSMNSHLQRILLAKSVVDSRNKNYLKRNQRYKVERTDDSKTCLHMEVHTNDVIDKLAYDTQHHPMDILRINLHAKHVNVDCYDYNLDAQMKACKKNYEEIEQMNRQLALKNQRMISPSTTRSSKRKKFSRSFCRKELKCVRDIPHIIGSSTCFSRQRKCRYEKEFSVPCTATKLDSPKSQSSRQKMTDYESLPPSVSQCYDFDCDEKSAKKLSKQFLSQKDEEKKYVKFVYDITKEIMQKGLYTDKELTDVFKKHINQYKGILNMNKMLYEIYQLKTSLNVADESDMDEELEDLIQAQKLLSVSEIRPPTPPKILDDNKIIEKLKSYQKMMDAEESSKLNTKSVMLVDANPDLFITERDVLMSLMEAGVDPKQVQHICKNLRYKSRDVDFNEAAQTNVNVQTLYSPDSKNLGLKDTKKQISKTEIINNTDNNSVTDKSVKYSEKEEENSTNLNLQNETKKETNPIKFVLPEYDKAES